MSRLQSRIRLFGLFCAAAVLLSAARAADTQDGFAFTIPTTGVKAGTAPALVSPDNHGIGDGEFVEVTGRRFGLPGGGRTLRFWGTNLCFQGCFPPHEVAERMARRMASLGINCVRFHHMDRAAYPRGIWKAPREGAWAGFEHEEFHPQALDRLDYLVAQLKKQGIYVNFNLHVSRGFGEADGFPAVGPNESVPKFGKGVTQFYPRCIGEQERYARMLLRHENEYTGNRYAREPAVAMVEISNENSLLLEWHQGSLDRLPEPYVRELEKQWNRWLEDSYADTAELRQAWSQGQTDGSDRNLLASPGVSTTLETHDGAKASMTGGHGIEETVTVDVRQPGKESWHVQLKWAPFAVQKGRAYRLRFEMRANRQTELSANCTMNHNPWDTLGMRRSITADTGWQEYGLFFTATADDSPDGDGGARINITGLSQEDLEVAVRNVSLSPAAISGLRDGEKLGEVEWIPRGKLARRTEPVRMDATRFLRETEVNYWNHMRRYIRGELGARMPITGTAVHFSTPWIAAETVDFVDCHAYWEHPRFPGEPWDNSNWIVRRRAMVNHPGDATIGRLAARRVFGMPYTVTEYNHPAPNAYEAEGFPLLSLYGALQDWDGIFSFNYASGDRWETDHFANFFDLSSHPAKMAVQPACADLVRKQPIGPFRQRAGGSLSLRDRLGLLSAEGPRALTATAGGLDGGAWRGARTGISTGRKPAPAPDGAEPHVRWTTDDEKGLVRYRGRRCMGLIGFAAGEKLSGGGITLRPGRSRLEGFSVVMLNAATGQELGGKGRYLLTAVSRCRNRGMDWNEQRNSVGTGWGTGPSLCDGVPLELELPSGGSTSAHLYALNPDGTRRTDISPVDRTGEKATYRVGPDHETLWYELRIDR